MFMHRKLKIYALITQKVQFYSNWKRQLYQQVNIVNDEIS